MEKANSQLAKARRAIQKGQVNSLYIGLMLLLGLSLLTDFSYITENNTTEDFSLAIREYSEEENVNDYKLGSVKRTCPKRYSFPEDVSTRFTHLEQISNYSMSNNSHIKYHKTIVILSPISNSAKDLLHFFRMICWLSYPHELISVVLGEDSSKDDSYRIAQDHAQRLSPYFKSIKVHHFKDNLKVPHWVRHRHTKKFQFQRRSHMAKARNQLLFHGLTNEDFVLWIDNDVQYVPHDIIQHLISEDKDIIVPLCMTAVGKFLLRYDSNTWKETNKSLANTAKLGKNDVTFEGYGYNSHRKYLNNLRKDGRIVDIDSVGGCVLMVKGDCHRKGLIFPPFVFEHQIETEGLGKMATKMGFGIYGLPHVTAIHSFITSKSFLPVT